MSKRLYRKHKRDSKIGHRLLIRRFNERMRATQQEAARKGLS